MTCYLDFQTAITIILSALGVILTAIAIILAIIGIKSYSELAKARAEIEKATSEAKQAAEEARRATQLAQDEQANLAKRISSMSGFWVEQGQFNFTDTQDPNLAGQPIAIPFEQTKFSTERLENYTVQFHVNRAGNYFLIRVTEQDAMGFRAEAINTGVFFTHGPDLVSGTWIAIGQEAKSV